MSDVNNLLDTMQQRFNPTAAAGLDAIFQYDIADEGSWQIQVREEQCEVGAAGDSEATVTLSMSKETLAGIISGEADGMQAFMAGDITASGDVMLATKLPELFPVS